MSERWCDFLLALSLSPGFIGEGSGVGAGNTEDSPSPFRVLPISRRAGRFELSEMFVAIIHI